jgi:hypothetical protein
MPDYKNGKIYKLWSPEGDEIYIGSTIQPLYARLSAHKKRVIVVLKSYLRNMMMLELN